MPECDHRRRVWTISPGLRAACTISFCHDCGSRFDEKALEALVKERYPDRPFTTNPLDVGDVGDAGPGGWQLACQTKWVCFLYPGELVGHLTGLLEKGAKASVYDGRDWLPELPESPPFVYQADPRTPWRTIAPEQVAKDDNPVDWSPARVAYHRGGIMLPVCILPDRHTGCCQFPALPGVEFEALSYMGYFNLDPSAESFLRFPQWK